MVISSYLQDFSPLDLALLLVNLTLMLFAPLLVSRLSNGAGADRRVQIGIFRSLNGLVILGNLYFHLPYVTDLAWGWRAVMIPMLLYMGFLGIHVVHYWIRQRYGKKRETEGQTHYAETYASRLLAMMATVLISLLAMIAVIRILGFDSLLEAGGAIGFLGVLLALTQGSWAPDIFAGLVILNSDTLAEGDVVELQELGPLLGVVYKTKTFHTEILNLVNNHRVMITNTRLRQSVVHNLSKFASAKGLREGLRFKIGYDVPAVKVKGLFQQAFDQLVQQIPEQLETQHPPEIVVLDCGDHAVEWGFFFYTKQVRNLLPLRNRAREIVLTVAHEQQISLATPLTHVATMAPPRESIAPPKPGGHSEGPPGA